MEENRFFEATARLKSEQIVSLDLGLLDQFDFQILDLQPQSSVLRRLTWRGVKKM